MKHHPINEPPTIEEINDLRLYIKELEYALGLALDWLPDTDNIRQICLDTLR